MSITLHETQPGREPFPISDTLVVLDAFYFAVIGHDVVPTPEVGDNGVAAHFTVTSADGHDVTIIMDPLAGLALAEALHDQITRFAEWAAEQPEETT